jgi:hypothetical protein
MFNVALKPPPKGRKGKWTEFPHPNHPSLESLVLRCHELHDEDPRKAPTIIFINEGDHEVDEVLCIKYPMRIIGAGRDKTTIRGGGFDIEGEKEEGKKVEVQDMTVRSDGHGVCGYDGLFFLCFSMTFTQCGDCGVHAENTKGRLINCVISQCGLSGIYCGENALIELEGGQTEVDGNGTGGYDYYGLKTSDTSSIIHLLFPLTKESVSTNNHNGQNYGSLFGGTIETVNSF